jgi:hypothetical protein
VELKFTRKVRLDRIGSATYPARLGNIVEVSEDCVADEGTLVVCRALGERKVYGELELPTGRMAKVVSGNILVGVLGARQALHGYMGGVPKSVKTGDVLSMLNIGGVIGEVYSAGKGLGDPIPLQVIGVVVRNGKPVNLKDYALPPSGPLSSTGVPLLLVMGTCMNSGKTFAAAETIRILSHSGVRIAAGKLSGVGAIKDVLSMGDNGAMAMSSFLECGHPSTVNVQDLALVARSVVAHLEKSSPELIVLELGDGIIGGYHVDSILKDESVRARTKARILCANDLVGAWGGVKFLDPLGHRPEVVSGPVTDNAVGTTYIQREMGITSLNARNEPVKLAQAVADAIGLGVTARD